MREIQLCEQAKSSPAMSSAEPGRKAPYPADLRWRMVWQRFGLELSYKEIARRLNIAVSTAHAICRKFEDTGDVQPAKPSARLQSRQLDDNHERLFLAVIMENPAMYLQELCQHISDVSLLRCHGFTRKKIRQVALQRNTSSRASFMAQVLLYPRNFFVWVDETGCDARNYMRKFGYSLRGTRAEYHRLLIRGQRISAVGAIASDGLTAVELKTGTVNADVFIDFARGTLIPTMQPFDGTTPKSIAVLDDCSVHHTHAVADDPSNVSSSL